MPCCFTIWFNFLRLCVIGRCWVFNFVTGETLCWGPRPVSKSRREPLFPANWLMSSSPALDPKCKREPRTPSPCRGRVPTIPGKRGALASPVRVWTPWASTAPISWATRSTPSPAPTPAPNTSWASPVPSSTPVCRSSTRRPAASRPADPGRSIKRLWASLSLRLSQTQTSLPSVERSNEVNSFGWWCLFVQRSAGRGAEKPICRSNSRDAGCLSSGLKPHWQRPLIYLGHKPAHPNRVA